MARRQSRRSISVNRSNYEAAKQEAARRGVSLAALVESALGAIGIPIVSHPQLTPDQVRASTVHRAASVAAHETAVRRPSRERQLLGDAIADACGFQ